MKPAVLVIGYNRPESFARVLRSVSEYKPTRLYISLDGPRKNHPKDTELVAIVRQIAQDSIWSQDARVFAHEENLGLRKAVVTALDWFFANEPEGIVLEDDCVPSPAFFEFMELILERHRNDQKVWGATGFSPVASAQAGPASYAFVRSAIVWGWCSWADRWNRYDRDLYLYKKKGGWAWPSKAEKHALDYQLKRLARQSDPDTWDTQLAWSVSRHNGLWGVPNFNTIMNLGVGEMATNTKRFRTRLPGFVDPAGQVEPPNELSVDFELQKRVHKIAHRVYRPYFLNYLRDFVRDAKKLAPQNWSCKH